MHISKVLIDGVGTINWMSNRFRVGDIVRKVHGEPWFGKVLEVNGDHLTVEFRWGEHTVMGYVSEKSVEMFQESGGTEGAGLNE